MFKRAEQKVTARPALWVARPLRRCCAARGTSLVQVQAPARAVRCPGGRRG